jgi:ectoine hydroxylase-related dioxygenase (phytanoyl-CoA dioxygenase family)
VTHVSNSGFAIVPGVFDPREMDTISREFGAEALRRSRAGARHLLSVPAVAALARDPRLTTLAAEVLGCEPVPFSATLFDKSSDANWLVVWHQDRALPLMEQRETAGWGPWSEKAGVIYAHAPATALSKVVALRVHLDDSTPENGPLRVLPGTHTLGVLSEAQIQEAARCVEPVMCTVACGGVIVMRPLIVHASSKVTADASRRVLHFEYAAATTFDEGLRLTAAAPTTAHPTRR